MLQKDWKKYLFPVLTAAMLIVGFGGGCIATPDEDPDDPLGEVEQGLGSGGAGGNMGPGVPVQECTDLQSQTDMALPDPNETYVPASLINELPADARVVVPFNDTAYFTVPASFNPAVPTRLRGEVYSMCFNLFCATIKKGQNGLFVVDMGGHFGPEERKRVLGGLAQIGNWNIDVDAVATQWPPQPLDVGPGGLPITGMFATHPHMDHNGNLEFLRQLFPQAKVVMTRWLADELRINSQPMGPPAGYHKNQRWWQAGPNTGIVRCRHDYITFEGEKIRVVTPSFAAHTSADSYVVFVPEKVMMAVDFVHPNRLPFINTSVVTDLLGYLQFIRHLKGEFAYGNVEVANWGHFNPAGYERDVDRVLDYFYDLKQAWPNALLGNNLQNFFFSYLDPQNPNPNLYIDFERWFDDVPNRMCQGLPAGKWDAIRHIEGCKEHAENLNEDVFLSNLTSVGFDVDPANPPSPQFLQAFADSLLPNVRDPLPPGHRQYNIDEYCTGWLGSHKRGQVEIQ